MSVGAGVVGRGGGGACAARVAHHREIRRMAAREPHALSGDGRRKRPIPTSTSSPAPTDGGFYQVQVTPEILPWM